MSDLRRLVPVIGMLLMLTAALPAFAASHGEEGGSQDSGTVTEAPDPEQISDADSPSVVVPEAEVEEVEQPWTARYLIPLLVVSAIVILIVVVISYNRSVRHRYKVVA